MTNIERVLAAVREVAALNDNPEIVASNTDLADVAGLTNPAGPDEVRRAVRLLVERGILERRYDSKTGERVLVLL
jgi:hypothetical protein